VKTQGLEDTELERMYGKWKARQKAESRAESRERAEEKTKLNGEKSGKGAIWSGPAAPFEVQSELESRAHDS
jgi:hypothetical protein